MDSPPLARGARVSPARGRRAGGLTPARAGSTQPQPEQHRLAWDSPPLARGARRRCGWRPGSSGLTPARAGSTVTSVLISAVPRTHPRSRGEHVAPNLPVLSAGDSPPLARGAPGHPYPVEQGVGLTPARAGSTRTPPPSCRRSRIHPRSRGEHTGMVARRYGPPDSPPLARGAHRAAATKLRDQDSPPLARGARGVRVRRDPLPGLTPARAGSTTWH